MRAKAAYVRFSSGCNTLGTALLSCPAQNEENSLASRFKHPVLCLLSKQYSVSGSLNALILEVPLS